MGRLRDLLQTGRKAPPPLPRWIERPLSLGIAAKDPRTVRRQRFTNLFAYASAGNIFTHAAVFGVYDPAGLALPIGVNLLFGAGMLAVPLLHRFAANLGAHLLVALSLVAILLTLWLLGRGSQIYVYFGLSGIILFMLGVENRRAWLGWFVVALVALVALIPVVPASGLVAASTPTLQGIVAAQAMVNVAVVNALLIHFVLATLRRTEFDLEDQYARSAALVSTLLPNAVVERLALAPESRIADRIDSLTVLFADLAGFTQAAHDLPPEEIVDWLDRFVRRMDELCEEAGAEKIKTIGDSYMAAGGFEATARDGALAAGRLALAMIDAQSLLPPLGDRRLLLRIGIHTGSATAGIIGDRRFSYDVWGDAVNMASRMEAQGLPGHIQVSDDFAHAAGGAFVLKERGRIGIKGIGPVRTWFLTGAA